MNWTLLHKYLSGETTAEEKQQVETWIDSDQRNREFMDSLVKIWEVEPGDEMEVDARAAWKSFKHRLSDEQPASAVEKSPKIYKLHELQSRQQVYTNGSKGYMRVMAMAATAAAVLLVAFLFYQFSPLANAQFADKAGESTAAQEVITERGQRTNLRLFDGTRVQLNAESKIRIPPEFGDSIRVVHLQGQAYFDVSRNTDKPFVVHSGNSYTRVLGTKFDVKAYPNDKQVQVVVEEGRVALSRTSASGPGAEDRHVGKGQIGLIKENGNTVVSNAKKIQKYLGWKDGRLIFDSTAFEEAIPQLRRWYDVEIVVADPSAGLKTLTASFKDEPMTEVMNIISLSLDLRYEREGRTITFYKN